MAKRVLRPMSLTQLFDEAFDLYKQNFLLFVGTASVLELPYYLLTYALHGRFRYESTVSGLLYWFISCFSSAALTWAISCRYLGMETAVLSAFRAILPSVPQLLLAMLVGLVVSYAGLFLCFVPGAMCYLWLCVAIRVVVLEHSPWLAAAKRARGLLSGYWGKAVAMSLLSLLLSLILLTLVSVPSDIIQHGSYKYNRWPSGLLPIASRVAITLLVAPVWPTCFTLLYYDMRVRKEGFDIQMLAKDLLREPDPAKEGAAS